MSFKHNVFGLSSVAALAIAGCATGGSREAGLADPYAAAIYTGAPQPDNADHFALLYAPEQTSANGAPFEVVSYAGIQGARRAHERYTEEEAEALDGRCERYVEASANESMIDIASLCDVPLEMLVDYNPGIENVSYAAPGAVIEIPGGGISPSGAFAMKDALADLYTVQEGDTLDKIAYRLNVSQASIANLNPEVYWSDLKSGEVIRRPATAVTVAAATSYAPTPAAPAWEGYSGLGIGASEAGSAIDPTAHAPYVLEPVKSYARPVGAYPEARLVVDRRFVKAGDSVQVTAKAAPGADVTFYSGEDPADLKKSKTVRADENGNATASIRVKKKANMGGVIFGARPEGSRETQFSDRVGVVRLKDKTESDEDSDEDPTEPEPR